MKSNKPAGHDFWKDAAGNNMHRVYFDGNEGPEGNERYGLWLAKSVRDLEKIPGGPKGGMTVLIYMVGEIEMDAVLEWDAKWNGWTGRTVRNHLITPPEG